jgi:ribonuclease J
LIENPSAYFFKISPWHISKIIELLKISDANIIYSQWLGYLTEEFSNESTVKLYQKLKNKYNWCYAHTGGHADLNTLQSFTEAIKPKNLIPIHTEYKDEFSKHFANVTVLADGDIYEVEINSQEKN